ncbi:MAG TPA: hypothetical protein ENG42_00470 [Candidatus Aenigmarchaeota archaeon]|nr:hypothetical protein [Candidatus Aenigmarchaeota archaeon]
MKAQTEVISLVLIAGIIVSLVGVAYFWGKPLIEKRTTTSQFLTASRFMDTLNDRIVTVARCTKKTGCSDEVLFPVKGLMSINEKNNSIIFLMHIQQPISTDGEIPMNTANIENVTYYGEVPGVIFFEGEKRGSENFIKFRLWYRTLEDEKKKTRYIIKLNPGASKAGTNSIRISFINTTSEHVEGYEIVRTNIEVSVL